MMNFFSTDYDVIIRRFETEERAGRRYRMGDLKTSLWLKKNNINFIEVKEIAGRFPDPRLVIIGEGKFSGFSVQGSPADCVKLAYMQLCQKPILLE